MVSGGRTPDVQSERRTYADVMTEQKLRAQKVGLVWRLWHHRQVGSVISPFSQKMQSLF